MACGTPTRICLARGAAKRVSKFNLGCFGPRGFGVSGEAWALSHQLGGGAGTDPGRWENGIEQHASTKASVAGFGYGANWFALVLTRAYEAIPFQKSSVGSDYFGQWNDYDYISLAQHRDDAAFWSGFFVWRSRAQSLSRLSGMVDDTTDLDFAVCGGHTSLHLFVSAI